MDYMLPERYLERPLWDEVLGRASQPGPTGRQLISSMHLAALALVTSGSSIIMDHVLVERPWLLECAQLFCDLPAYLVGVRCLLPMLEEREKARRNRTRGQAAAQYDLVHAHIIMIWKSTPRCSPRLNVHCKSNPSWSGIFHPPR